VLGAAIARTSPRLRRLGIAYAVLVAAFTLSGFFFPPVQAFTGFALAVATAYLAVLLPRTMAQTATSHVGRAVSAAPVSS
jgi:hypothetical protein